MGCDSEAVNNNTLILNSVTCFNSELKLELVVGEQACWNGQVDNMLLVKLLRSIVHVNALRLCVTVPGDSIQVTINGFTNTVGVHLTQVNFSSQDVQNDPICGNPVVNLVQGELDVHQVGIHLLGTSALGDIDFNSHVVAARSKQSQEVREVGLVLLRKRACQGVGSSLNCNSILLNCVFLNTLVAWAVSCGRDRRS